MKRKPAACGCNADGPCAKGGNGPKGVAHYLKAMTGKDVADMGKPSTASPAAMLRAVVAPQDDEGPWQAVLVPIAALKRARSFLGLGD